MTKTLKKYLRNNVERKTMGNYYVYIVPNLYKKYEIQVKCKENNKF